MSYGMADVVQRRRMIDEGNAPDEVKRLEHGKLNALLGVCETAECRRRAILSHFGEAHEGNCGNCDTCRSPVESWDGTEAAIKAMGANDAQLLRAFLYQGLIIGLVGTTFGLGFGYVVCRWILAYGFPLDPKVYFIDRLPVQIRPEEFVLTGTFAIAACMLATLWPALHAARLRPAEAFREA